MEKNKIKVTKNGVTKEIDACLKKDYIANGWIVLNNTPNYNPFSSSNYVKK